MMWWRKWRGIWEIGKGEDERIGGKENGVGRGGGVIAEKGQRKCLRWKTETKEVENKSI